MSENFTSFTFGSSGLRVVRPGRDDPPVDPDWYLPSTPSDGDANTIEKILDTLEELRERTTIKAWGKFDGTEGVEMEQYSHSLVVTYRV